jgi:hypothetical protein
MNALNRHSRQTLLWLYVLNASILITHEIDSAYQEEWILFGLPGGVQWFLFLNLVLVIAVLYGLVALAQQRTAGIVLSWTLVAGGLFAVVIHGYFILSGDPSFRLPASLFLLGATLVLSVLQGAALIDARSGR